MLVENNQREVVPERISNYPSGKGQNISSFQERTPLLKKPILAPSITWYHTSSWKAPIALVIAPRTR